MDLNTKQKGVLCGMVTGASVAIALIVAGIVTNPFAYSPELDFPSRVTLAIKCCLLLAACLAISIGRLAKHRFFSPEDIDGSSATEGTQRARILQSLIQNTLEQALFAALVYLAWSVMMPATWLSVVPMAAIAFATGRVLFFVGYRRGAASRAIGFTLAFYPSVGMLIGMVLHVFWKL